MADEDWSQFDVLVRELGSLRAATDVARAASVESAVRTALDTCLADAADAVNQVIAAPNDDEGLVHAWETILRARDNMRALAETAGASHQIVARSVELRRRALAAMGRAKTLRRDEK